MAKTLEFPHYIWKEGGAAYGVEVGIDLLPPQFEGKWLRAVEGSTERWVRSTRFKKAATLWMWGTMSINFGNNPGLSEFVVPVGLPEPFLSHLHDDLFRAFRKGVRYSEAVPLVKEDGWTAICHIQDGIVWVEEDTDLWTPYVKTGTA